MRVKFWIGFALTVAIVVLGILVSGGQPIVFVDIPSLAIVILIPAAIAFASWPVRDIGRAFSALYDEGASRMELEKSLLFFDSLRRWMSTAAFMGLMIGLVSILRYYTGNETGKLGPNLAVMLLCNASALFFMLLVPLPLASLARRRLVEARGE